MDGVNSGRTNSVDSVLQAGRSALEMSNLHYIWNLVGNKGELKAMTASTVALVDILPVAVLVAILAAVVGVFFLWRRNSTDQGSQVYEAVKEAENEDVEEEDDTIKKVSVFFATQTGTAENFAKSFAEEGKARYGNKVVFKVIDLDDYAADDKEYETRFKKETVMIHFVATYGDGEPTDNSARFYKWLTETMEEDGRESILSNVNYAVFGLGNTQYEHFNKCAITIDNCFEKQGGVRLIPCGLGNDDQCIEDDCNAWREQLWPELDTLLRDADDTGAATPYVAAIPEYRTVIHENGTMIKQEGYGSTIKGHAVDAQHPVKSFVAVRRELHTPLSDRSCTHLEFDISGIDVKYETGDHVGVYAENHQETVEEAANLLGYPLDTVLSLYVDNEKGEPLAAGSGSLPPPFPCPTTLESALARYADLLTPPKKTVFSVLATYATDPQEAERLKFLASPLGKEEYSQWVATSQRTLLEVMAEFPSAKVPLGVFFAAVSPRLQPRFYSISSSPRFAPNRIHVTCALLNGPSPTGRLYRGVSSTWMKNATSTDEPGCERSWAPIFVRTSTFRLPSDPSVPILMVGPGTGLAPFRGFLQERAFLQNNGAKLGLAAFFFGCRTRKQDYIYDDELESYLAKGTLSTLNIAFSREGPKKEYVQDKLLQEATMVWDMISSRGHIYVCGDAKGMAKDVHRVIHKIIQDQGKLGNSETEALVKQLQTDGRYQRDIW